MVYYSSEQLKKEPLGEKEINQVAIVAKKKFYQRKIFWIFFALLILAIVLFGYTACEVNSTFNKISSSKSSIWENIVAFLPLEKKIYKFLSSDKNLPSLPQDEEKRINILILGIRGEEDPNGGLLSDTIMIISLKPETNQVALISIPRDLWVEMLGYDYYQRINYAYALGEKENFEGGGLAYSKKIVSYVSGLPIHYAFSVDFTAFKEIIDILGGVTIYLEKPFSDPFQFKEGTISLPSGLQNIDGKTALLYVRARHASNDFDRARRQQQILLAIKNKALNLGVLANPLKTTAILKTIGRHVRTDMELWEIQEMFKIEKEMQEPEIIRKVFDTSEEGLLYSSKINGLYILLPVGDNFDKIHEACREIFNNK